MCRHQCRLIQEGAEPARHYTALESLGLAVMSKRVDTSDRMPPSLALSEVPQALDFSDWVGNLVREHRATLASVARHEGLTADEALDAVQEALLTFVSRPQWHRSREEAQTRALLNSLVKNVARNARRLRSRKDLGMDSVSGSAEVDIAWRALDELLIEAQAHVLLTGCIATLKEIQRTVVTSRFFEGASGQVVAQQLEMTPGHVAVILHRAHQSLRGCLEQSRDAFHLSAPAQTWQRQ